MQPVQSKPPALPVAGARRRMVLRRAAVVTVILGWATVVVDPTIASVLLVVGLVCWARALD